MAVHCVNSTVGPEGLCPTLCVFGALPRPARNTPAPQQLQRAQAIDKSMDAVAAEQGKRKLALARRYRGPFGGERSDLDSLQYGALVRVYRNGSRIWEGPFRFVAKDGDTVCVQLPHGRRIFSSHVVKPDLSANAQQSIAPLSSPVVEPSTQPGNESAAFIDEIGDQGFQARAQADVQLFKTSRAKELQGLLEAGVFKIVERRSVLKGTRIYGT